MKEYCLIIFFIILFTGCQELIEENENIKMVNVDFIVNDDLLESNIIYHVYFYNTLQRDKSAGINVFYPEEMACVKLFPGTYDVYAYGLIEKNSSSYKVNSYCINNSVKFFENRNNYDIKLQQLLPDAHVLSDDKFYLVINFGELYKIMSLSSVSVKQGESRAKSLTAVLDNNINQYTADIPFVENGAWYMNISYILKSKKDKDVLEADGIKISTSYFSDTYLGEF